MKPSMSDQLDGKILYFEMHTKQPDNSMHFFTTGWAKMDASKSGHVSIMWLDYPGAPSGKAVTLTPETVAKFKKNDSAQTFELHCQKVVPDFIYVEPPPRDF